MKLKFKRGLALSLGAAAILAGGNALAADKELLDMLLKNGAIDSKQYDTLMKKAEVSTKDGGNIITKLNEKGLGFETADKNFAFRLNGRIHADAIFHGNDGDMIAADNKDTEANDGTHIRRARLEAAGTFWKNWDWRMQYEFAKNKADDPHWRDMWIRYNGGEMGRITAGHQKRPFSLQEMMSSNDMVFAERSFEYAFIAPLERAVGLGYDINGKNWTAAIGVFGEDLKSDQDTKKWDQGWSTAGRATFAPIAEHDKALHLGASAAYTKVKDSSGSHAPGLTTDEVKFKVEPTSDISSFKILEAHIPDVESYTNVGVEAAGMYGPFSLEGEYVRSFVDQDVDGSTLSFDGWHIDGAWSITGESRHYDGSRGVFGRLKPNRNFDLAGGWGAWELKARYHALDMNDAGASEDGEGGRATAATVGLNWYLNQNVRLMVDHTHILDVDSDLLTEGDGADLDYTQLRASLAF